MTRGRYAQERGFTLIEMVIAMALSLIVVGGPMAFVVMSLTEQNVSSSRSAAVEQESVGLTRLTRDLRQVVPGATSTFSWTGTSATASLTLPLPGTGGTSTEAVVWSCSFATTPGTCTRQVNSGTPVQEVSGVKSVVFAPVDDQGNPLASGSTTQAAYVGITVKVLGISQLDATRSSTPAALQNPITLQDGVALRNNT